MPAVWLQAVIVVCAYVGYKATDDFSLLARDALGFDDVAASAIGTLSFWIRAVTAVAAGYLGDRIDSSRSSHGVSASSSPVARSLPPVGWHQVSPGC